MIDPFIPKPAKDVREGDVQIFQYVTGAWSNDDGTRTITYSNLIGGTVVGTVEDDESMLFMTLVCPHCQHHLPVKEEVADSDI